MDDEPIKDEEPSRGGLWARLKDGRDLEKVAPVPVRPPASARDYAALRRAMGNPLVKSVADFVTEHMRREYLEPAQRRLRAGIGLRIRLKDAPNADDDGGT